MVLPGYGSMVVLALHRMIFDKLLCKFGTVVFNLIV